MTYRTIAIATAQLIVYGAAIELLEPLELATEIVAYARAALECYGASIPDPARSPAAI